MVIKRITIAIKKMLSRDVIKFGITSVTTQLTTDDSFMEHPAVPTRKHSETGKGSVQCRRLFEVSVRLQIPDNRQIDMRKEVKFYTALKFMFYLK